MTKASKEQLSRRIKRELETVEVMIAIYCRGHHHTRGNLCSECLQLWQYTKRRVEHCRFRLDKPTCLNCSVHCFKPDMRERVREVMRYAGPRMPLRHPVLSLFHFIDGKKGAPEQSRSDSADR